MSSDLFASLDIFSTGLSQPQQTTTTQQQTDDQYSLKIDSSGPELVILVGPPCSGKTFYYYQHYRATHIRISATELFQKDRELSFRSIIQNRVIKCLQEGKNVVIDDANHLKTVRESYIQALLKSETTLSRIVLYNFIPSGGELQIQWATAWSMCERSMANNNPFSTPNSYESPFKPIDYLTFKSEYHTPLKREGYHMLKEITTPLFFNQHSDELEKELSNIALFLDARVIFRFIDRSNQSPFKLPVGTLKFKYSVQLFDGINVAIKQWVENYPHNKQGQHRVILLIDELALFPSSIDFTDQLTLEYYRKEVRKSIKQLSDTVCFPIYYYYVPAMLPENEFYRFPNLGLFAVAQYRHRLSLQKSIVVVDDLDPKLSNIPFNVIHGSKFFQETSWTIETKVNKNLIDNIGNLPSFLESIQFVNYDDLEGFVVERGMPMYSKIEINRNEKSVTEEHLLQGKRHGVYFPHEEYIKRNQQKDIEQQQEQSDQVVFDFDIDDIDLRSTPSPVDPTSKPLPWVSNRFMVEYGIDSQSVYRGDTYFREARLSSVEISHSEPDFSSPSMTVTAQCKGTTAQPYSLLIRYRMKGNVMTSPILDTQCNCPNGVRTYGKCKHIVSLFYYCNANYSEKPITNKLEEISSNTPVKRKLPEWMSNKSNSTSNTQESYKRVSPNKKTLNLYFPENEQNTVVAKKKYGKAELKFEKPSAIPTPNNTPTKLNSNNNTNNNNNISNTTQLTLPKVKLEDEFNQQSEYHQQQRQQIHADTELFIQQLLNSKKISNSDNENVDDGKDTPKTPPSKDGDTAMSMDNDEFCVPRTNSEEFLRASIKKDLNNTHQPIESFPLVSSQDGSMSNSDSQPKKKISLKMLLESQGIRIPNLSEQQ